jgi:hypothetical protein
MKQITATITLIVAIALMMALLNVGAAAQDLPPELPTMSSTSWVATPTPIVAEPVILVYEVWIPMVSK